MNDPQAHLFTGTIVQIPTATQPDSSDAYFTPGITHGGPSPQDRMSYGQCPNCGQKLYKQKRSIMLGRLVGANGRSNKTTTGKMKPLTIEGHVERGQCLHCCPPPASRKEGPFHSRSHSRDSSCANGSLPMSTDDGSLASGPSVQDIPFVTAVTQALRDDLDGCTDNTNGSRAPTIYKGLYNDYGERHGPGTMTWSNGDRYEGYFFNGNRHGHGTLFFADGSEYVGEWECNHMHGNGTRRFPSGDVYTGTFVNGQRQGQGRFYYSNGDMYLGEWNDNQMNGKGRYYYSAGQRFEGTFVDGKRHGPGKFQRMDGSLDLFVYHQDVRTGTGIHWSVDRTKAWKCQATNGRKKRVSIEQALTLAYEIESCAQVAANGSTDTEEMIC